MSVTVIIVNFNGRELTPACLESIPAGTSTIVIDNGSTDGSPEEIAERFPGVTLVRNKANLGFARAVNQGIALVRGSYLCLLNNDARLAPDTLSSLAGYMDAHPDVGMTAPQLVHEDGRRQHSFDNFPSLATVFLNKSLLRLLAPGRYPSKKQEVAEPREVESVIGACMMVRRDLLERIGALDEAYFLFLEETDWCLRARRAGAKVVFVPSSRVVHLQGRTRDKVRFRARIEYTRSLFTFFRKQRPGSSILLRAFFPVRNAVELIFQTFGLFLPKVRRRWVETASVLGWQLCGCPRAWGLSTASDPKYMTLRDGTRVREDCVEPFNDFDSKRRQTRVLKDLKLKKTLEYAAGGRTYLIKIYKGGSWGRRLKAALLGSRARHEFNVSLELQRRGIPTAPIVALREGGGENWVACEKIEGAAQLQDMLLSPTIGGVLRRRLCRRYGRFARRLVDSGVWQYDFNPTNILVRGDELLVIDFERMKVHGGAVPRGRALALLAKMNRIPLLSRTDRLRFLKGYLDASSSDRAGWKETARELLRRYDRQVARDADRSERRCLDENRDFGAFDLGEWRGHYLKKRPERPGGLTMDELRAIAASPETNGAWRAEPVSHGVEEWKKANRRARDGGPRPFALLERKAGGGGKIVYPKT